MRRSTSSAGIDCVVNVSMPGDVLRVLRQVAGRQAAGLAGELRLRGLTLIERVKDDALLRIVRGQLQRVGAPHPSDGDPRRRRRGRADFSP